MPDGEDIVWAFFRSGITGEATIRADSVEAGKAPGEELVRISLMASVPDEIVSGGIEDIVEGDGQLDSSEVGGEVAAGMRYVLDKEVTQLIAELRERFARESAQVGGGGDAGEQGKS